MLRMDLFHLQEHKTASFVPESLSESQDGWDWQGLQRVHLIQPGELKAECQHHIQVALRDLQGDSTASLDNFATFSVLEHWGHLRTVKLKSTAQITTPVYSKSEYLKAMQYSMHCFQCYKLAVLLHHSGLCSKLYNCILFALPFSFPLHEKPAKSLAVGKNNQTNSLIKLKRQVTCRHIFYP